MDTRVNYLLLATAFLGTFFSGMGSRIFIISMPTLASSLGTDLIGISWALLAYQLSNIGFSLIFGRLSDIWGRENVFATGFAVFSLGSLFCGLSQTVSQLIFARFFQGIGSAMIQSSSRALAAEAVPQNLSGRAQGYMTTAHHTGFLLGPTVGGLMIDYLNWRWTFFFLVPIGIFGALLTLKNPQRDRTRLHGLSIDYAGAALLFATTTTLVLLLDRRMLALMSAEIKGAFAVIFTGSLLSLLIHESKAKSPVLNLALFKIRGFAFSALSLLIVAICYALTAFLLPFYLQDVLRLSPSFIGFLFMAPPILTILLAPVSGHMADRLGASLPQTLGVAFMFLSLTVGVFFTPFSHWLLPTLMIALSAVTNGLFNPAASAGMLNALPRAHRGFASATNHVTFGLGNVLGVALGGLLMTAAYEHHTAIAGVSPTPENPGAFVAALNTTFLVTAGLSLLALLSSATSGSRASAAN
ncbi:MAG: MFS transporter [Deltaproteobacteria bacterium]|nr:MFS transporter [Deltaproteobacteria bacterium]